MYAHVPFCKRHEFVVDIEPERKMAHVFIVEIHLQHRCKSEARFAIFFKKMVCVKTRWGHLSPNLASR